MVIFWLSPGRSQRYAVAVRRVGLAVGTALVILGVFWAGRESGHGSLSVFWEHWWCPLPLAIIFLGVASVIVTVWCTPAT